MLCDTSGYAILDVMKQVDLGDRMAVISRVKEEHYVKDVPPLKLGDFLMNCSEDKIALQRSNYL